MKVADQLEETRFVFDDDGLIPVLEEMAHPMAPVEDLRAPGKERAHRMGPQARAPSDQPVLAGREERPGAVDISRLLYPIAPKAGNFEHASEEFRS